MTAFRDRIAACPHPAEPERADQVLSPLPEALRTGPAGDLLRGAVGCSPYLGRLATRHATWLEGALAMPPEAALDGILTDLDTAITDASAMAAVSDALRLAKGRAALLIALADLGAIWGLAETTEALTAHADRSIEAAARWLLRREVRAGKLPGLTEDDLATGAGYMILAMGKMGAGELNYSSDIDLIALFDDSRFEGAAVLDARARYIAVTRDLVKLLSENTAGGYAFRVDLRLRPSPSTTPVCMAVDAAERYYESVGRTWERAAHIKARPLVDLAAGEAYLATLAPFIWRRHLDFAAIEDTQIMLRKIREQKVAPGADTVRGRDLKLGRGGIREIEFFVQTRQLIVGGRDAALRIPTTLGGLDALHESGWIEADTRDTLAADYVTLRNAEHRLQMIEDAQTHSVPKSDDAMARFAGLCGFADPADVERQLADCVARVHAASTEFFAGADPGAPAPPSQAPDDALARFQRPADAARQLARWNGGIAATRGERARALYQRLEPQIIDRLGQAGDPDQALAHFDRFLSGLPAGVQLFSLFSANPRLLDLIIEICTAAPRLAAYLGRRAETLDALLDRTFWQSLPELPALEEDLAERLAPAEDYERVLDATRRWAREQRFRVGLHVLRGLSDAPEAGAAFTRIAETCVRLLLPRVIDDFATRHGPPPGRGLAVVAMGKLGSQEMTDISDLDMIMVYDGDGAENSDGPRPLATQVYYPRLTQALVAALTAPTAEGVLYEVDMRLRPSGRQGPVAVSLAGFEKYQMQEAWVWEHMALTRARVIAGPQDLNARLEEIIATALAPRQGTEAVLTEAREMRARIVEAHAAERDRPWSLKHAAGGLMDIEFLAQVGALHGGLPGTGGAATILPALARAGWLSGDDSGTLETALLLQRRLQQIERVAVENGITAETLDGDLGPVLARAAEVGTPDAIEPLLRQVQADAAGVVLRRLSVSQP